MILRSVGVDTGVGADTAGVSLAESDEALLSPSSSPRVLDFPVGIGGTDQKDGVVDGSTAVVEDTRVIAGPVTGINGDRDGFAVDGVAQTIAACSLRVR